MTELMDKFVPKGSTRKRREKRFEREYRKGSNITTNINHLELYVALRNIQYAAGCLGDTGDGIKESILTSTKKALRQFRRN